MNSASKFAIISGIKIWGNLRHEPERLFLEEAAGQDYDYIPAICALGLCYELGEGVETDLHHARELYEKAGRGVKKDLKQAIAFYRQSAALPRRLRHKFIGCVGAVLVTNQSAPFP